MPETDYRSVESIGQSLQDFDITRPLTDEELVAFGLANPTEEVILEDNVPVIKDIDEVEDEPFDAVAAEVSGTAYNIRYRYYLQCQAIATLADYKEGWDAFVEFALKNFVKARRLESDNYRGDNPSRAFALLTRKQAAEDFVKFIHGVVAEAAITPKPKMKK